MTPGSGPLTHAPIRSFVLRQGRLSGAQERAIEQWLPVYGIPFATGPLELDACFGRTAPKILEIGSGMGDTTAEIAAGHPERDYLAVEVHAPGVGNLLKLIVSRKLCNVRVIRHDAVEVLEHMIRPASLDGVHLFFPDPWPKKRHHKRRLVQPAFVELLGSRMKSGSYLHAATDWEDYAQHILGVLTAQQQLVNTAAAYAERPPTRPLTRFERRGLALGHKVWDVVFTRK